MRRILPVIFVLALFIGALPIMMNASAASDNTWIADVASSASVAGSWQNGSLVAGQNIWFTSAHVGNCSWDVANSFGNFTIRSYTNTITQAASFSVNGYIQATGTIVASTSYLITDSGSFIVSGGSLGPYIRIKMSGDATTINIPSQIADLQTSANVTFTSSASACAIWRNIIVDSGKTLSIAASKTLQYAGSYNSGTWTNNGIVSGTGTLSFWTWNTNFAVNFGIINCPVSLDLQSGGGANISITLTANAVLGSSLNINSLDATYSQTLDLSQNNYSLSANGITIGTRGIINGRASSITCSGSWDSSAGTFTPGTSQLYLTGASKTIKTATERINNLILTGSYSMLSNVYCQYYWNNGSLSKGAYLFYVNHNQAPAFITTPLSLQFYYGEGYTYTAQASDQEQDPLTYSLTTNMTGLTIGNTTGIVTRSGPAPSPGYYSMNIAVSDGNHTTWQNYTLREYATDPQTNSILTLALALIMCFGLVFISFSYSMFWFVAGIAWIGTGLTVFIDYGQLFMVIGLGLGIVFMIEGAFKFER